MYLITRASLPDLKTIQHLANEIWPEAYKEMIPAEQIRYMLDLFYSIEALTEQMYKDRHQFLLLKSETEPIGYASFSETEKYIWKLHKLYVLPQKHNSGAGRSLMHFIIEEVKKSGGKSLQLQVNRTNPARSFYEKNGFRIIAEQDFDIGEGFFMNDYIMELSIEG